ncbi:hypothetical protein [Streptomyces sp. UNOB3_S3]|uniref:hypothetical protein n=1 Tax=Streptomyces sp. UNOB3_S3 TaxID=2871682 RepID=UPI001E50073E|nr:hypothetical protein [Streptomyces sp. UNOB3_S3]MCC3779371.1 hypothetical protein [Streptomyces sp. UNOB3_S3]
MTVPRLRKDELGPLAELSQGGQGTVWKAPNVRVNRVWPAVFKEYHPHVLPDLDVTALETMVAFLGSLPEADGKWIADRLAWPAGLVTDAGKVCGFVMREVPSELHMVIGKGAHRQWKLQGVQFLLNPDSVNLLHGTGPAFTDRQRVRFLIDLAYTLARLHTLGVVVGDLSPQNLLFSQGPEPTCFFIDCDAMRIHGRSALPQAETPDWQAPPGEPRATTGSDSYKFALLAIRLFARTLTDTDSTAIGTVSGQLWWLAQRGLLPQPSQRPSPGEWIGPLLEAAQTASTVTPVPDQHAWTTSVVGARAPTAGSDCLTMALFMSTPIIGSLIGALLPWL